MPQCLKITKTFSFWNFISLACFVFFPVENIKSLNCAMPRDVELEENENYIRIQQPRVIFSKLNDHISLWCSRFSIFALRRGTKWNNANYAERVRVLIHLCILRVTFAASYYSLGLYFFLMILLWLLWYTTDKHIRWGCLRWRWLYLTRKLYIF